MSLQLQNLTIRPESVQSLYATYKANGFVVNRRYQRKLVWTIEEKRAFVDSLKNGYPVPLFLFAEQGSGRGATFEIIDGMQRLNSVFAFLEGEFDLEGKYFDLNSIPETKELHDAGTLKQREPTLSSDICRAIVTYQAPLSITRESQGNLIDDIFRRINSHGRHLSRQELRQAGSTSLFAQLVRQTATSIRGDVSAKDTLPLMKMREISITNRELAYGIDVSKLFWVENRILTADQVRESRDEELIADIFGYVLLSPRPPSNSNVLDEFYDISPKPEEKVDRFQEVDAAVRKHGILNLSRRFTRVHDTMREVLKASGKHFNQLMFSAAGSRVPRYYQVVFLALYELLVNEAMQVKNAELLAKKLDGIGEGNLSISEGGSWSAADREKNVDAVKGVIKKAFRKKSKLDPAEDSWVTEFENVLTQSKTENNLYDFKQGIHTLQKPYPRDPNIVRTIAETLAAMANHGLGATGYVLIGVTDEARTAKRLETERQVTAVKYRSFHVTGVDHEAGMADYKKGLDSYFQWMLQQLKGQPLTPSAKAQILKDARLIDYSGRHVVVLKVTALNEPCAFDEKYFQRNGPNNDELRGEALKGLFSRFRPTGASADEPTSATRQSPKR